MIELFLAFFGVYVRWGWADWMFGKDTDPISSIRFLLISQFNDKPSVCLFIAVCFSSHSSCSWIKRWVCFSLCPLSWGLGCHVINSWPSHEASSSSAPCSVGGFWALRMCGAASLAGLMSSKAPHFSLSWGRLKSFLPKCKMVTVFLTSSIWVKSILFRSQWLPNGFLLENSNARYFPLSPVGSYILFLVGQKWLCFGFLKLAFIDHD